MGNPWVRKSQPTPVPAHTIPIWPQCGMKPGFATSQKQPAHINRCGGAFCEVLEEEVVVVMWLV